MLTDSILSAPRAALAACRQRLENAAAALERGRVAARAAEAHNIALDNEDDRRAAAYAAEVERAAADGTVAVPYLEVPLADAAERHRAAVELRGAEQAVTNLAAAHVVAQTDLNVAEEALREAVDQVLEGRSCALIETAEQHLRALETIGTELARLLPDSRFEATGGLPSEPAVRELVKRLPNVPRSDIDVPVNELRHGGARVSHLASLRAELTRAAIEQPAQAAA